MTWDRVAIHEAGHAVARVVLGLGLLRVTVVPDEESLGRVVPVDDGPDEYDEGWDEWLEAHAVSLLAGHEAERRVSAAEEFGIEGVVDHDWHVVTDIVFSLGGQHEERQWTLLNRLLAEARVLLARNWSAVETVAGELRNRGTLSGAEIAAIIPQSDRQHSQ